MQRFPSLNTETNQGGEVRRHINVRSHESSRPQNRDNGLSIKTEEYRDTSKPCRGLEWQNAVVWSTTSSEDDLDGDDQDEEISSLWIPRRVSHKTISRKSSERETSGDEISVSYAREENLSRDDRGKRKPLPIWSSFQANNLNNHFESNSVGRDENMAQYRSIVASTQQYHTRDDSNSVVMNTYQKSHGRGEGNEKIMKSDDVEKDEYMGQHLNICNNHDSLGNNKGFVNYAVKKNVRGRNGSKVLKVLLAREYIKNSTDLNRNQSTSSSPHDILPTVVSSGEDLQKREENYHDDNNVRCPFHKSSLTTRIIANEVLCVSKYPVWKLPKEKNVHCALETKNLFSHQNPQWFEEMLMPNSQEKIESDSEDFPIHFNRLPQVETIAMRQEICFPSSKHVSYACCKNKLLNANKGKREIVELQQRDFEGLPLTKRCECCDGSSEPVILKRNAMLDSTVIFKRYPFLQNNSPYYSYDDQFQKNEVESVDKIVSMIEQRSGYVSRPEQDKRSTFSEQKKVLFNEESKLKTSPYENEVSQQQTLPRNITCKKKYSYEKMRLKYLEVRLKLMQKHTSTEEENLCPLRRILETTPLSDRFNFGTLGSSAPPLKMKFPFAQHWLPRFARVVLSSEELNFLTISINFSTELSLARCDRDAEVEDVCETIPSKTEKDHIIRINSFDERQTSPVFDVSGISNLLIEVVSLNKSEDFQIAEKISNHDFDRAPLSVTSEISQAYSIEQQRSSNSSLSIDSLSELALDVTPVINTENNNDRCDQVRHNRLIQFLPCLSTSNLHHTSAKSETSASNSTCSIFSSSTDDDASCDDDHDSMYSSSTKVLVITHQRIHSSESIQEIKSSEYIASTSSSISRNQQSGRSLHASQHWRRRHTIKSVSPPTNDGNDHYHQSYLHFTDQFARRYFARTYSSDVGSDFVRYTLRKFNSEARASGEEMDGYSNESNKQQSRVDSNGSTSTESRNMPMPWPSPHCCTPIMLRYTQIGCTGIVLLDELEERTK